MSQPDLFPLDDFRAPTPARGTAEFSLDLLYRYTLHREWGAGPRMLWCMLNPSTADAFKDDPTIRRCVGFAKREGCGSIVVVNLYAWRSTEPAGLTIAPDPIGARNMTIIREQAKAAERLVAAWGASIPFQTHHRLAVPWLDHMRAVTAALRDHGDVECLGTTAKGYPRHPLYVPANQAFAPFALEAVP